MQRNYRWATQEGEGLEHLVLRSDENGVVAEGVVIGPLRGAMYAGAPFACSYTIRCDAHWRVREVAVVVAGGARLALRADGLGHWCDGDGAPLATLAGCIDIDLTCSPFTNTLPIRRMGAALCRRQEITVAYVTLPEATVMPSRQAYTARSAGRYRFESLSDPFEAEIETDSQGMVLDYPGLFRRVGGS